MIDILQVRSCPIINAQLCGQFSTFPLSLTSMDSPLKITLAHLQHLRNLLSWLDIKMSQWKKQRVKYGYLETNLH